MQHRGVVLEVRRTRGWRVCCRSILKCNMRKSGEVTIHKCRKDQQGLQLVCEQVNAVIGHSNS